MNDTPRHIMWVWDLDRDDARMHLLIFVRTLFGLDGAKGLGKRSDGRYVMYCPARSESGRVHEMYTVPDLKAFEDAMRHMLQPAKFTVGVTAIWPIVQAWRAISDLPIQLNAELPDPPPPANRHAA